MRISDWSSDVCSSDLRVVGRLDPDVRGVRQARAQIGQRHPPGRQWLVGDDQQGLAPLLRLVPGVKERFLVMTLGVVEQPAAGLADEGAAQKAAAGLARTGEDRRHDRPERPALEMVERGARSEEHTSELPSLMRISSAVFCLQKKQMKSHNE